MVGALAALLFPGMALLLSLVLEDVSEDISVNSFGWNAAGGRPSFGSQIVAARWQLGQSRSPFPFDLFAWSTRAELEQISAEWILESWTVAVAISAKST